MFYLYHLHLIQSVDSIWVYSGNVPFSVTSGNDVIDSVTPISGPFTKNIYRRKDMKQLEPRSHALIYIRYVNYAYMYNLHPGVKINLRRVHMFLNKNWTKPWTRVDMFLNKNWTKPCINPLDWEDDWFLSET